MVSYKNENFLFYESKIIMDILIRNVDIHSDILGIREAHGSDEHWGSDEACFHSTRTSLENGFFI